MAAVAPCTPLASRCCGTVSNDGGGEGYLSGFRVCKLLVGLGVLILSHCNL